MTKPMTGRTTRTIKIAQPMTDSGNFKTGSLMYISLKSQSTDIDAKKVTNKNVKRLSGPLFVPLSAE